MTQDALHRPRPCLTVDGVGKRFGPTVALQDVRLSVVRGQVHALLGHNGSGKSTLVKIISGVVRPDTGSVIISAADGTPARVGVVHQDLGLSPDATVLENCWLGGYRTNRMGFIDWVAARRDIQPVLDRLVADFRPDDVVGDLSPANQAVVAIARALRPDHREPAGPRATPGDLDLLILDEATARLRGPEAEKVLATARRVARDGGGVLLVTHHMSEVLAAADRATVLRSGRVSGAVEVAGTTEDELLEMVSGRKLPPQRRLVTAASDHLVPRLVVNGLCGEVAVDVDLVVGAGEVVGLTGAAGAGFEEVPYLLAGATAATRGRITVDGARLCGGVAGRRRQGVSLVPADRLSYGLLTSATNRENISPLVRPEHRSGGFVRSDRERRWAARVCSRFSIQPPDPEVATADLSGGNQQKVLLARALADKPKVLILHEPTQGVDEGARRGLVEAIRSAAAAGTAVLYVSADIEEVAAGSDRVLVIRNGTIAANLPGGLSRSDDIYAVSHLGAPAAQRERREETAQEIPPSKKAL